MFQRKLRDYGEHLASHERQGIVYKPLTCSCYGRLHLEVEAALLFVQTLHKEAANCQARDWWLNIVLKLTLLLDVVLAIVVWSLWSRPLVATRVSAEVVGDTGGSSSSDSEPDCLPISRPSAGPSRPSDFGKGKKRGIQQQ